MRIELHNKRITLIHGDCLEVMPKIKSGIVNMVFADLPYGTTACKWDTPIDLVRLWAMLRRISISDARFTFTAQQPFTTVLGMSNLSMLKYSLIWEKDRATGHLRANYQPLKAHEDILIFYNNFAVYNPQKTQGHKPANKSSRTKQAGTVYNAYTMEQSGGNTDRYPRSVLKINTVNSASKLQHSTQKPVELLEYLINTYTNENDLVFDPTMGSGTTGIACLNTNRRFIGIEKDKEYFDIAVERIKEHANKNT